MARLSRASGVPLWTALLGCCIVNAAVAQQAGVFRAGTVTLTQMSFYNKPKRYVHLFDELVDFLNEQVVADHDLQVGDSCNGGTIFSSETSAHFSPPDSVIPIITSDGFTLSVALPMTATVSVSGHAGWLVHHDGWGDHCFFGSKCSGDVVLKGSVGATTSLRVAATPDGTVTVHNGPTALRLHHISASGADCPGWLGGSSKVATWFEEHFIHDASVQRAVNDFASAVAAQLHDQWSNIPVYSPYPDIYVRLFAVNTVFSEQSFVRIDFNASVRATMQKTGEIKTIIPHDAVAAATLPPPVSASGTEPLLNVTANFFLHGARFSSTLLTVLLDAAHRSGATNKTMTTTVIDAKLTTHLRYAKPHIDVPVDDSLSLHVDWGVVETRCMSSGPNCGALMLAANVSHLHCVGNIEYQESPEIPPQLNLVVDSFDTERIAPFLNAPNLDLPSSFVDNVVSDVLNGLKLELDGLAFRLPDYAVEYFPNPKIGIKNQAGCCGGDHGYIEMTLQCDCSNDANSPWLPCDFSPCQSRSSAELRGTESVRGLAVVESDEREEVEVVATPPSARVLRHQSVDVFPRPVAEAISSAAAATSDLILLTFPTSNSCDLSLPGQQVQTSYLTVDGSGTCRMQLPQPAPGLNASSTYYTVQAHANARFSVWQSCTAGCQEASCTVIMKRAALNQCYAVSGAPNLSVLLTPAASPCIGWAHQTSEHTAPPAMILETTVGAQRSPTCNTAEGTSATISNVGPVGACTDASAGNLVPGSLETVVVPNASQPSVLQLYSGCRFNCAPKNCTTSLGPLTQGTCVPHQDGSFYMANRVRPLSELPLCSPPVLPPYAPPPAPPPMPYESPHSLILSVACFTAVCACGVCISVKREQVSDAFTRAVDVVADVVVDYFNVVRSRRGVWPKYYVDNGESSIILSSVALAFSSAAFYVLGATWHSNSPFTSFTHGNLTRLGDLAQDVNFTELSTALRSWSSHGHDLSWIVATCLAVVSVAPIFIRLSAKAWHRAFAFAVLAAFLSLWGMITLPGFFFSIGNGVRVEAVSASDSSTLFGKSIAALVTTWVRRSIATSVCLIVGHLQLFFLHSLFPSVVVATVLFSITNRHTVPYGAVHLAWAIQWFIVMVGPVGCLVSVLITYHAQTMVAEPIQESWLIMWGVYWFGCVVCWMLLRWSLLPDRGVPVVSDCGIFNGVIVAALYVLGFIQVSIWLLFGENAVTAVPLEFTAVLLMASLLLLTSAGWVALQYWRLHGWGETDKNEVDRTVTRHDDYTDDNESDEDSDDAHSRRRAPCGATVTKHLPAGADRAVAWLLEVKERGNPAVYGIRAPGRRLCCLIGSVFFALSVHHFYETNVAVSARDQFAAFVATLGSQLIWPSGKTLLDGVFEMYHSAVTQEFYTMLVAVVPIGIACMLVDLCCMRRKGLRIARRLQFIGVPILLGSAIVIAVPPFATVIPVKQVAHPCAPNFDRAVATTAGTLVGFTVDFFIITAVAPLVLLVPSELIRSAVVLMAAGVSDAFRAVLSFMMVAAATLVPLLFGFLALAWFQILGDGVDGRILAALLAFLLLPLVGAWMLVRVLRRSPSSWWLYPVWLVVCYLTPFCLAIYYTALRLEMLERLILHLQSFWTWAPLIAQVCIGAVFVSDQLIIMFNQIAPVKAKAHDGDGESRPIGRSSRHYGSGFGSDYCDRSLIVGSLAPNTGRRRRYSWSSDVDLGGAAGSPIGDESAYDANFDL